MGHLLTVLLFTLGWLLTACGSDTDEPADDSNTPTTATDTTAPTLAEVTAVTTSTNDTTPAYTFSSTEAGTAPVPPPPYRPGTTSSTSAPSAREPTATAPSRSRMPLETWRSRKKSILVQLTENKQYSAVKRLTVFHEKW